MKKFKTTLDQPLGDMDSCNRVSYSLQLYEKGCISKETLLDVMGFDSKKEVERKKNDLSSQLPLVRKFEETNNDILSQKIEHARRNVEVLSKILCVSNHETSFENKKRLLEIFGENIEILSEVKNFK
jgi:hypothetical protein